MSIMGMNYKCIGNSPKIIAKVGIHLAEKFHLLSLHIEVVRIVNDRFSTIVDGIYDIANSRPVLYDKNRLL